MKSLRDQLVSYYAYHQNKTNRIFHLFGVPTVVLSLLIALDWVSMAIPFYLLVMGYYIWLDREVGGATTILFAPVLLAAIYLGALPFNQSVIAFLIATVVGWSLQFAGHHYEGKRPAFFSNISQLLNGPLLVAVEILFFFGLKRELKESL